MRSVLAIARLAIRQCIRWRLASVVILVYLLVVPSLPFVLEADGTLVGQLRLTLTWSLFFAALLLGLLTVILATGLLWREIAGRQIYILDTKPVHRWQVFLGKYLGMMALVGGLLLLMGAFLYVVLLASWRSPRWGDAERAEARSSVLTCRRGYGPEVPNRDALAAEVYSRMKADGSLPEVGTPAEITAEIRRRMNQWQAGQGGAVDWTFSGLPAPRGLSGESLTLRFQYFSSSMSAGDELQGMWEFGRPDEEGYARAVTFFPIGSYHEFDFPAAAVTPGGTLALRFSNIHPAPLPAVFSVDGGVEVLGRSGSFGGNLARALAAVFFLLAFLGALGLFASTFLSGPVAAVVVLSLLLIGAGSTTVVSALQRKVEPRISYPGGEPGPADYITLGAMRGIVFALPNAARYFPASRLQLGREVSWSWLALQFGELVVLRGGLLSLLGCWILSRREIAGAT